jgi:hypothetical protein
MKQYVLQPILLLAILCMFSASARPHRIPHTTNISPCSFCNCSTGIIADDPLCDTIAFCLPGEATTLDSVCCFHNVPTTLPDTPYKKNVIVNNRLKSIAGWRTLNKVGHYYIITGWQSSEKMFIYNKVTAKLDSLYITSNDSLIRALIKQGSGCNIDIARMKAMYKAYNLPYSLIRFGTNALTKGDKITSSFDLFYIDPGKTHDTISSEWLSFVFTYKPSTREMKILPVKDWESDSANGFLFGRYKLDYQYYSQENDSTWLLGGKEYVQADWDPENSPLLDDPLMPFAKRKREREKGYAFEQLFCYFTRSGHDQRLRYSGRHVLIPYDSLYTFDGEKMNEPGYLFRYGWLHPYIFYHASPFIYNTANRSVYDIRKLNADITWIHAMHTDEHVVRILTQENTSKVLYVLWKHNLQLIKRIPLGDLSSRNTIILEKENLYFMNNDGHIVEMVK